MLFYMPLFNEFNYAWFLGNRELQKRMRTEKRLADSCKNVPLFQTPKQIMYIGDFQKETNRTEQRVPVCCLT